MSEAILPRVLSLAAAGRYLGGDTSVETLRSWTKPRNGCPPLLRKVNIGRRAFVLREDIDRLIDRQLADDDETRGRS